MKTKIRCNTCYHGEWHQPIDTCKKCIGFSKWEPRTEIPKMPRKPK